MGFRWILCDDQGVFKAVTSNPWHGLYTVKEAKVIAVRETLS